MGARSAWAAATLAAALTAEPAAGQTVIPSVDALVPQAGPSGLALGLRLGEDYRTLYLVYRDGQVTLAHDVPYLVAPQARGFWRLGSLSLWIGEAGCGRKECPVSVTKIWASDEAPDLEALRQALVGEIAGAMQGVAGGHYRLLERIEYVATGVVCRSVRLDAYTGGAHPNAVAENHCLPLTENLAEAEPLDYPTPGGTALATFQAAVGDLMAAAEAGAFEEVQGLPPADLAALPPPRLDPLPFRLARVDGHTLATLLAYTDAPHALSSTYTLTAAVPYGPAGPPHIPYNPVPAFFDEIRAQAPDLRDVFVSPEQNVIFLLSGDRLSAIEVASRAEIWTMPLAYNQVVMVDWAGAGHADTWTRMIARETE